MSDSENYLAGESRRDTDGRKSTRGRGRGSAKTRGTQNPGRKEHNKRRQENFRQEKGAGVVAVLRDKLKEELYVGNKDTDAALAKIVEAQTLKAITLSITTRSIGFSCCYLSFMSAQFGDAARPASIYAQYRFYLGVLEAKLEWIRSEFPLTPEKSQFHHTNGLNFEQVHAIRQNTVVPEPIKMIVDAVGILKFEDRVYLPAVQAVRVDARNRFIPRAENVVLSTLRRTVESISNPLTPLGYRTDFENHNPIPGAIWNDHVLQNPDDIIPADYDFVDDFRNDATIVVAWQTRLQKCLPKLVGTSLDLKALGKPSSLIANEMETLRCRPRGADQGLQEYYGLCLPNGNVRSYYAPFKLTAADKLDGQCNLLGEVPSYENMLRPVYVQRDENICPYFMRSDYKGAHIVKYGAG